MLEYHLLVTRSYPLLVVKKLSMVVTPSITLYFHSIFFVIFYKKSFLLKEQFPPCGHGGPVEPEGEEGGGDENDSWEYQ